MSERACIEHHHGGCGLTDQLHLALFYVDDREYLDGIMGFIGPALADSEPVAIAVPPQRARVLRERLNGSARQVRFLDMFELGRNPARITPALDPLVGRRRPVPHAIGGLGLWVVSQLCDLVEARTGRHGTTVRAHVRL